ncbi:MAG TPA: hypothetical protein VND68_03210 [Chloroflexia bacterium]|jgi:hypothetical protein|nr:hypothetical protein [Chloroflexia bacterium]
MAKKGSRPNKANQQRSREEQWRRRAAAQGGATSVVDGDGAVGRFAPALDDEAEFTAVEMPSAALMPSGSTAATRAAQPRTQGATASASASQRRATSVSRQNRARFAPTAMSIEDEMYYVRSDIRRLILLTAACVLVLIVLFFLIPR